jgi:hypothetical protein
MASNGSVDVLVAWLTRDKFVRRRTDSNKADSGDA